MPVGFKAILRLVTLAAMTASAAWAQKTYDTGAGDTVELGDPEIHEQQEGAATLRRLGRHQMGRPEEFPVDHGLPAQLPERGPHLRQIHPRSFSRWQDRGVLAERRCRERPVQGI